MQKPTWLKPAVMGAIVGAAGTMILGFTQGGWFLGSSAERMANLRSTAAVTEALVPLCISQSKADPYTVAKLDQLSALKNTYERRDFVMKAGWATTGAAESPNSAVAMACAEMLSTEAQS